jgi:thiaminase (transcriptional activator TenA)
MTFSTLIWTELAPLRAALHGLPFIHELVAGTLAPQAFQHYIVQDSLYLSQYARVLSLAAARAPDRAAALEFAQGAQVAIQVEEALHQSFFERFGVSANAAASQEPSPACLGYTSYLLSVAATGSYAALAAAILPCFWVYWDVGCAIKAKTAPDNPYSAWIDTYADPSFGDATERVRAIVDTAHAAKPWLKPSPAPHAMNGCSGTRPIVWKLGGNNAPSLDQGSATSLGMRSTF